MGNAPSVAVCKPCCEAECEANAGLVPVDNVGVVQDGTDLLLVSLTIGDKALKPAMPVLPSAKSSLLKSLEGRWFLQSNLKPMCEIWNAQVFFDPISKLRDTVHPIQEKGPDAVSFRLGGHTLTGRVSLEAQAAIKWDNGETWIKQ